LVGVGLLFDLTVTLSDCESCLELPAEGVEEAVPLRGDRGVPERTLHQCECGGSHCWQGQLISELTQLPEEPRPYRWLGVAEERHFGAGHDVEKQPLGRWPVPVHGRTTYTCGGCNSLMSDRGWTLVEEQFSGRSQDCFSAADSAGITGVCHNSTL
jgi:hypothetical protein